jgi:hypothetical protein
MRLPDKMLEDVLEYGVIAAWQPFQQLLQLQQFHVSILQEMMKIKPCQFDQKEIFYGPTCSTSCYFWDDMSCLALAALTVYANYTCCLIGYGPFHHQAKIVRKTFILLFCDFLVSVTRQ